MFPHSITVLAADPYPGLHSCFYIGHRLRERFVNRPLDHLVSRFGEVQ